MKKLLFCLLFLSATAFADPYYFVKRTYLNLEDVDFEECARTYRFLNGNFADCTISLKDTSVLSQITYPGLNVQSWSEKIDLPGLEVSLGFYPYQRNTSTMNDGMSFTVSMTFNKIGRPGYLETIDAWRFGIYNFETVLKKALAEFSDREIYKSIEMVSLLPHDNRNFRDDVSGVVRVGERFHKYDLRECEKTFSSEQPDWYEPWISGCSLVEITESMKTRSGIPLTPDFWAMNIHRTPESVHPCGDRKLNLSGDYLSMEGGATFNEIRSCVEEILAKNKGHSSHFIYKGTSLLPGERAVGTIIREFEGRKALLGIKSL